MCICVYEDCVCRINSLALWQFHYSQNEISVLCQWHGFFKETKCEAKRVCWIPKTQFWIAQSNFLLVGIKLNKFTLVFPSFSFLHFIYLLNLPLAYLRFYYFHFHFHFQFYFSFHSLSVFFILLLLSPTFIAHYF